MLARAGLSDFTDDMLQFGIQSVDDLLDASLVTDHDLTVEIGLKMVQLKRLRKVLKQMSGSVEPEQTDSLIN